MSPSELRDFISGADTLSVRPSVDDVLRIIFSGQLKPLVNRIGANWDIRTKICGMSWDHDNRNKGIILLSARGRPYSLAQIFEWVDDFLAEGNEFLILDLCGGRYSRELIDIEVDHVTGSTADPELSDGAAPLPLETGDFRTVCDLLNRADPDLWISRLAYRLCPDFTLSEEAEDTCFSILKIAAGLESTRKARFLEFVTVHNISIRSRGYSGEFPDCPRTVALLLIEKGPSSTIVRTSMLLDLLETMTHPESLAKLLSICGRELATSNENSKRLLAMFFRVDDSLKSQPYISLEKGLIEHGDADVCMEIVAGFNVEQATSVLQTSTELIQHGFGSRVMEIILKLPTESQSSILSSRTVARDLASAGNQDSVCSIISSLTRAEQAKILDRWWGSMNFQHAFTGTSQQAENEKKDEYEGQRELVSRLWEELHWTEEDSASSISNQV